jgi:hypothetical protein
VLPFTGLIPVLLILPLLAVNLYAIAIVVALASGATVIAYHLGRGQGVTSLDVILIGFASANAVLYFGFGYTLLLDHIDAVIYTVLAVQATLSLRPAREPWTTQFTKRIVDPGAWELPEFQAVNRFSTTLWAIGFAACDVIALVAGQPWRLYGPIVLLVGLAVASRPLSRAYLGRLLGVPAGDPLPAPWTSRSYD